MGVNGKFGDYTGLCPLIQVGEGTSTPHLTWTDEPLPQSGLVVMELGAARRHYHAPLTRTAHIGPPSAKMSRLADAIVESGDLAIEAAKPGATCEERSRLFGSARLTGTVSRRRVAWAIPSDSTTHPIGASAPRAFGRETRRCYAKACVSTFSPAFGSKTSALQFQNPSL